MKPRLLDLYCGAGGAAMGYHRAGFEVTGVDINPQRHYPFEFHQGDAIAYCRKHGCEYDVIHASPPCQAHSSLRFLFKGRSKYKNMIPQTRAALIASGKPYVIENVPGAPLVNTITLCGTFFHLSCLVRPHGERRWLRRHRLFESNLFLMTPGGACNCKRRKIGGVYGQGRGGGYKIPGNRAMGIMRKGFMLYADEARAIMGCEWMNRNEVAQAIPPVYTEYIGRQIINQL